MTLILSGTNGLSDVDGSAATPAIRGTDANTGIFFPAADTIGFAKGGAEAMRIDSAGNLNFSATGQRITGLMNGTVLDRLAFQTSTTNGSTGVYVLPNGSGTVAEIRLSGTSDPTNASTGALSIVNGTDVRVQSFISGTGTYLPMTFYTGGSERVRIDTSGNVGIGATSGGTRLLVSKNDNTYYLTDFNNTLTSGNGYINRMLFGGSAPNNTASIFSAMVDTGGNRCIIYANGGIHNYQANNANLSDRREKTNFSTAGEYLSKICAIPVQTFNYIDQNIEEDAGLTLGVIAQDVQAVAPELVMESNWGTEEDPKMRLSIYQTDLQYALMKCIQEQQALITGQQAMLASLTARIEALETPTP